MKFAFISRHQPTKEQLSLAEEEGISIVPIGDTDAFTVGPEFVDQVGAFDGVIVVHPAAALRLCSSFVIGIFENGNRAPEGERPQFFAKELHLYDLRD